MDSLLANAQMATAAQVTLSFWPRFLNAPGSALTANDKTQFQGRDKPNAYLKMQLTQDRAGAGATKPLTWSAMYPVLDGPRDDITNKYFDDPVSGDPVENVPIPGSTAKIITPLTAIVGGAPANTFVSIIGKVLGIAGSTAGKALFPIPAADITLATNVESLLDMAGSAFAPDTKQQFWLNNTATRIRTAKPDDPADDALLLPKGTSFLAAFPDPPDQRASSAVNAIVAKPDYAIGMDRGGVLFVKDGSGQNVLPNPFDNLIYVTFRAIVTEG